MYGKLFTSMYDGTLAGNWKALVTFQQFIVLATAHGTVDMTTDAISRRTGIPIDIIREGVEALEQPDVGSRTPDLDGRRIERLDAHRTWGWRIVNHERYQRLVDAESKKEADRARIAAKRETERAEKSMVSQTVASCRDKSLGIAESRHVSQGVATSREASTNVANVAHTDTDTDTDTDKEKEQTPPPTKRRNGFSRADFDRFWQAYPRKCSKGDAEKAFAALHPDEPLVARIIAGVERATTSEQWRKDAGNFIPYPATWLRAKGWEDELPAGPPGSNHPTLRKLGMTL